MLNGDILFVEPSTSIFEQGPGHLICIREVPAGGVVSFGIRDGDRIRSGPGCE